MRDAAFWLGAILLGLLAGASALLTMPRLASPAPARAQAVAFDYRNTPDWRSIVSAGYANAVISPHGQSARGGWAGDSLRAHGVRTFLWMQPWLGFWHGAAVRDWTYDDALWGLCLRDSSFLRDDAGRILNANNGSDVGDAWLPDFRDTVLTRAYGETLARYWSGNAGWYMDYGDLSDAGIGWVWGASNGNLSASEWARWSAGYRVMTRALRTVNSGAEAWCFCGHWRLCGRDLCQIPELEGVGPYFQNLYPYAVALDLMRGAKRQGGHGFLFCQRAGVPSYRRVTAAIALLTDAWFNWQDFPSGGNVGRNLQDPEHFELDLGGAPDTCFQRWPYLGVWERVFTRGLVLANLGSSTCTFQYSTNQTFVLPPGDALVLVNRDPRGRWIKLLTDYGR